MDTTELVYVGLLSRVIALSRHTGEIVWTWTAPEGRSYSTLLVDGDMLFVSIDGYTYGLVAKTGRPLWSNPLKGFGSGVASLATSNGSAQNTLASNAAKFAAESG